MTHIYFTSATPQRLVITLRSRHSDKEVSYRGSRELGTFSRLYTVVDNYRRICPAGECRVFMRLHDGLAFRREMNRTIIRWLGSKFSNVHVIEDDGRIYGMPGSARAADPVYKSQVRQLQDLVHQLESEGARCTA